jgi:hypothetical protein
MKTYKLTSMRLRANPARRQRGWITARELDVLHAVQHGQVDRDLLYGDLGPWMLGTRQVSRSISLLVFHGLVRLGVFGFGPPQITTRGLRMLDSWADLLVLGDQP